MPRAHARRPLFFVVTLSLLSLLVSNCTKHAATPVADLKPQTKTFALPTLSLVGNEQPMGGKEASITVNLSESQKPEPIWIVGFHSRVMDEQTHKFSTDFICHSHVVDGYAGGYPSARFLGNQNGSSDLELPKGFGVRMISSAESPLILYGMALDYSHRTKRRKVHYEISIDYYDDATAARLGLKELDVRFASLYLKIPTSDPHKTVQQRVHWQIPHGTYNYRYPLNSQLPALQKGDIRVYHVHNHLHPYGDWGEVFDVTENRTVWRGHAKTHPDVTLIESLDHYSSEEGFVLKKDHQYEVRTQYTNPKKQSIDGMLTMRFFFRPEGPNVPRVLDASTLARSQPSPFALQQGGLQEEHCH